MNRRIALLLGLSVLCPTLAAAQVMHDASSTPGRATATSVSVTHTTGSESNRLLIACHHVSGAVSTGATYNGASMTLVDSQDSSSGFRHVSMYKLLNPPTGSYTLQGTTTASQVQVISGKSFTGVDQTTPVGTQSKSNGGGIGTSLSATVSSSIDGMGVDCLTISNAPDTPAADTGQTNVNTNDAGSSIDTGTSTEAGASSITMGWSWTGGQYQALIVAPLNPASDASSSFPRRRLSQDEPLYLTSTKGTP